MRNSLTITKLIALSIITCLVLGNHLGDAVNYAEINNERKYITSGASLKLFSKLGNFSGVAINLSLPNLTRVVISSADLGLKTTVKIGSFQIISNTKKVPSGSSGITYEISFPDLAKSDEISLFASANFFDIPEDSELNGNPNPKITENNLRVTFDQLWNGNFGQVKYTLYLFNNAPEFDVSDVYQTLLAIKNKELKEIITDNVQAGSGYIYAPVGIYNGYFITAADNITGRVFNYNYNSKLVVCSYPRLGNPEIISSTPFTASGCLDLSKKGEILITLSENIIDDKRKFVPETLKVDITQIDDGNSYSVDLDFKTSNIASLKLKDSTKSKIIYNLHFNESHSRDDLYKADLAFTFSDTNSINEYTNNFEQENVVYLNSNHSVNKKYRVRPVKDLDVERFELISPKLTIKSITLKKKNDSTYIIQLIDSPLVPGNPLNVKLPSYEEDNYVEVEIDDKQVLEPGTDYYVRSTFRKNIIAGGYTYNKDSEILLYQDIYDDYLNDAYQHAFIYLSENLDLTRSKATVTNDLNKIDFTNSMRVSARGIYLVNPNSLTYAVVSTHLNKIKKINYKIEIEVSSIDTPQLDEPISFSSEGYDPTIFRFNSLDLAFKNLVIYSLDSNSAFVTYCISYDDPVFYAHEIYSESETLVSGTGGFITTINLDKKKLLADSDIFITAFIENNQEGKVLFSFTSDNYEMSSFNTGNTVDYYLEKGQSKYVVYFPQEDFIPEELFFITNSNFGEVEISYSLLDSLESQFLNEDDLDNIITKPFVNVAYDGTSFILFKIKAKSDAQGEITLNPIVGEDFELLVDNTVLIVAQKGKPLNLTVNLPASETQDIKLVAKCLNGSGDINGRNIKAGDTVKYSVKKKDIENNLLITSASSKLTLFVESIQSETEFEYIEVTDDRDVIFEDELVVLKFPGKTQIEIRRIIVESETLQNIKVDYVHFIDIDQNKLYISRNFDYFDYATNSEDIILPVTDNSSDIYVLIRSSYDSKLTIRINNIDIPEDKNQLNLQIPRDVRYILIPEADENIPENYNMLVLGFYNFNKNYRCSGYINGKEIDYFSPSINIIDASDFRFSGAIFKLACTKPSDADTKDDDIISLTFSYVSQAYSNSFSRSSTFKKFKITEDWASDQKSVTVVLAPENLYLSEVPEAKVIYYAYWVSKEEYNKKERENSDLYNDIVQGLRLDSREEFNDGSNFTKQFKEGNDIYYVTLLAHDIVSNTKRVYSIRSFDVKKNRTVEIESNKYYKIQNVINEVDLLIKNPSQTATGLVINLENSIGSSSFKVSSSALKIDSSYSTNSILLKLTGLNLNKPITINIQFTTKNSVTEVDLIVSTYFFNIDDDINYRSPGKSTSIDSSNSDYDFNFKWDDLFNKPLSSVEYTLLLSNLDGDYNTNDYGVLDYVLLGNGPSIFSHEVRHIKDTFLNTKIPEGIYKNLFVLGLDSVTGIFRVFKAKNIVSCIDLLVGHYYTVSDFSNKKIACFTPSTGSDVYLNISDNFVGDSSVTSLLPGSVAVVRSTRNLDQTKVIALDSNFVKFDDFSKGTNKYVVNFIVKYFETPRDLTYTLIRANGSVPIRKHTLDESQPNIEFNYFVSNIFNGVISIRSLKSDDYINVISPKVKILSISYFRYENGVRQPSTIIQKNIPNGVAFRYNLKDLEDFQTFVYFFEITVENEKLFDNENTYVRTIFTKKINVLDVYGVYNHFSYSSDFDVLYIIILGQDQSNKLTFSDNHDFSDFATAFEDKKNLNEIKESDFNFTGQALDAKLDFNTLQIKNSNKHSYLLIKTKLAAGSDNYKLSINKSFNTSELSKQLKFLQ